MKLLTAKTAADIKIPGVHVELTMVDKAITGATLRDKDGKVLAIFTMASYSFTVQFPAPVEVATAFHVKGTVLGIKVDETYSTERKALDRREQLLRAGFSEGEDGGDCHVSSSEIEKPDTTVAACEPCDDTDLPF